MKRKMASIVVVSDGTSDSGASALCRELKRETSYRCVYRFKKESRDRYRSCMIGWAAPKCVYQETNCINMSWVCWMEFCSIMDRSRKFSPVWNNFDLVTPNKVNLFLLYILFKKLFIYLFILHSLYQFIKWMTCDTYDSQLKSLTVALFILSCNYEILIMR